MRNKLLEPRLHRILDILADKTPKQLSGKQKGKLKNEIEVHIEKALKNRYKKEIERLKSKSFILRGSAPYTYYHIKRKIPEYEEEKNQEIKRFIYTFWRNKECLYVGQTKKGVSEILFKYGKGRLFTNATKLKIYLTDKIHLDRYENIAYHVFAPSYRYNLIHTKNRRKKCPFCKTKRKIDGEIDCAFVLKW
ncbi:MAG: hypothetical protein WC614_01560 [bacterium]